MKIKSLLILFFFLVIGTGLYSQVRVDPPSWWAGMKNPELQLMVYGDDISATTPVIEYDGVTLHDVVHVESPDYLFLSF
ncbi:MAG: hypothetical protein GXO86_14795 [Chlorobi bacterium]|nr:hypothetical protein [Chlorobiota bacterium]